MGWLEIVLLCAVGVWLVLTVIWLVRRKGTGCCGDCSACGKNHHCQKK